MKNNINNITKILLLLFIIMPNNKILASNEYCGKSYSALVYDATNGDILFEKNSEKISYPASLVKLMTLYLTFEALDKKELKLDDVLIVSRRGEEISRVNNGNSLHLKAGDKITVEEAIRGIVVKSFNEAAVTLSEAVSGDEWEFVRKMNKAASHLGMINTSFRNASGLHEDGQYTTAFDLARLAYAIKTKFPNYYPVFASKGFTYKKRTYVTHNHVLLEYDGAEGMKTGFTRASGFNLIAAAKRKNQQIFSIIMGCDSQNKRDQFTKALLDYGFKKIFSDSWQKNQNTNLKNQQKFNEILDNQQY
jgi:D-alanyl-D-alanine carboxypeptidase